MPLPVMQDPRKKGIVSMTSVDFPQVMQNRPIIAAPLKAMQNLTNLVDKRNISATTGKKINPNVDLVSGAYQTDRIVNIVKAAKRYGIDPYDLLAIDLQETGLGNSEDEGSENVGHVIMRNNEFKIPSRLSNEEAENDSYDQFARAYVTKMIDADRMGIKDPLTRMQVYNGLGSVGTTTEIGYNEAPMKKIYGVSIPSKGINLRKNPLYGKRIIDLKENVLKKDPNLALYINKINP